MLTCVLKYRMATFSSEDNETFSLDSIIRGHHVYKLHWIPVLGQELEVQAEPDNTHDPRAVATCLDGNVVGHLPIEFSRVAWHFLNHGGQISCVVTGQRKYSDVPNKGLEVPCTYTFTGKPAMIKRLVKVMTENMKE